MAKKGITKKFSTVLKWLNSGVSMILLVPVMIYRKILSPMKLQPSCKFYPTCSTYMVQAIKRHGALKGLFLGINRLFRCHPWSIGGVDKVPEEIKWVEILFWRGQKNSL